MSRPVRFDCLSCEHTVIAKEGPTLDLFSLADALAHLGVLREGFRN